MQDAYVVDQQNAGTFDQIGFDKPTSTVFVYTDLEPGFQAVASSLDKCSDKTWKVTVSVTSGKAKYTATDNCPVLTPNFKFIGSSNGAS